MMFFLVAFGVLVLGLFWGAGAAVLAMPRPWRRFWPVLAIPAGFTLQSLVVWLGAQADWPGTNHYARASLLVPTVLLIAALRQRGLRRLQADCARFGVLGALMAGGLGLLLLPMAIASRGLTTLSLGSCDAADYAAGARVFMEFAHSDRDGFLGLTDVVRVMSADNFFDFWLRLNHFTPSALIALNGSIFNCSPFELTGVLTAVVMISTLPLVFWTARAVVGYASSVSLWIAAVYGLSPITWYAVAHVAIGQLLAAQAIALLTWAGVALWRGRETPDRAIAFGGVSAMAYALLLGAYNFMLLVCLVPALAYAGGLAIGTRQWRRLGWWVLAMVGPLFVSAAIFFERVAGLVERFALFQTFDFGWRIPLLTPEGWLGMVSGPEMQPWDSFGLRWLLAAGVTALLVLAFVRSLQRRQRGAWIALCLSAPVLAGYAFLEIRGARLGTNASYDAYKLFAVFFPGILAAACWWVTLRRGSRRLTEWVVVACACAVVLAFNLVAAGLFFRAIARAPLAVGNELKQLRRIEAMPDVASVNVRVPDMWSRLWANQFLLRKPQYFLTDTYEARWHSALRGEWDLEGGIVAVAPQGDARRQLTAHYALVDTRSPGFLRASVGTGWNQDEVDPKTGDRWQWTRGEATLQIENPRNQPLLVSVTLDGWSPGGEPALTLVDHAGAATRAVAVGSQRGRTVLGEVTVPPGVSVLTLRPSRPAVAEGAGGGARKLGICVFQLLLSSRAK